MKLQVGNKILRFSHDSFHSEIEVKSVDEDFAYTDEFKFHRAYREHKLFKVPNEKYNSVDCYDDFVIKNPTTVENLKQKISKIQAKVFVDIVPMLVASN